MGHVRACLRAGQLLAAEADPAGMVGWRMAADTWASWSFPEGGSGSCYLHLYRWGHLVPWVMGYAVNVDSPATLESTLFG